MRGILLTILSLGFFLAIWASNPIASADEVTSEARLKPPALLVSSEVERKSEKSILSSESSPGSDQLGPNLAAQQETLQETLPEPPALSDSEAVTDNVIRIDASKHAWARFNPGAWRRERITSEAFDEQGQFIGRSVTERSESLAALDNTTYTVLSETAVDLAGRRTPGPSEERQLWRLTDTIKVPETIRRIGPSAISLAGEAVPCETWEFLTKTEYGELNELLYYSETIAPYVLRREQRDFVEGEQRAESAQSVVRTNVPVAHDGGIVLGWHTATTRLLASGARTERFAVHCESVPGGMLSENSIEYDPTGRRIRWTVTHLIASGRSADEQTAAEGLPTWNDQEEEIRPRRLQRLMRRAEEALQ